MLRILIEKPMFSCSVKSGIELHRGVSMARIRRMTQSFRRESCKCCLTFRAYSLQLYDAKVR